MAQVVPEIRSIELPFIGADGDDQQFETFWRIIKETVAAPQPVGDRVPLRNLLYLVVHRYPSFALDNDIDFLHTLVAVVANRSVGWYETVGQKAEIGAKILRSLYHPATDLTLAAMRLGIFELAPVKPSHRQTVGRLKFSANPVVA